MLGTSTRNYFANGLPPSPQKASVGDAMHPGVVTCRPGTSLRHLARIMAAGSIHAVVVEGYADGYGIVSALDVALAVRQDDDRTAGESAVGALAVAPETRLLRAAQLMADSGMSHLVVVSDESKELVGILSALDIAAVWAWGLD